MAIKGMPPMDWGFEAKNYTDYEIKLKSKIENKLMDTIFQKARRKLSRSHNIRVGDDYKESNRIKIPEEYLYLINTIMRKAIRLISADLKSDRITILTNRVTNCEFVREPGKDWLFSCILMGEYVDKR